MRILSILFFWFFTMIAWSNDPRPSELEQVPDFSQQIKKLKVKQISDLTKLSPFDDISVIQRRFLPKTNRFELNLSFETMLNDNFYYIGGGSAHLGFFITEKHGLAVEGHYMLRQERPVTAYLSQPPNSIKSYNLIASQIYAGAYYKWSPFYGKFAALDRKIIYFDMFFTLGGGMTKISRGLSDKELLSLQGGEVFDFSLAKLWWPTVSLGLGQVFAISKNFGFSWDLKWKFYLYRFKNDTNSRNHSDLSFSLGLNYYFPGARYR